jgi:hypothetical protein
MTVMSISPARWFLALLCCLALLTSGAGGSSAWAAKKKPSKSWPGKKKHPHKKHAPAAGAAAKSGGAAPAEDADEGDEESAQGQGQGDDEAQQDDKKSGDDAGKAKPRKVAKSEDEGEDERSGDSDSSDDDEGGSTVVRKKAKKRVAEDEDEDGAAPLAFELMAGSRVVNRNFSFNDPLSDHQNGLPDPSAYQLQAAPAPFIQLGLYPAAFATRGLAASFGLVGGFEKVVATKTNGTTTQAQQLQAGLRFRLPLGAHEIGLTGAYGQQLFRISSTNPAPMATGVVPNVTYTFGAVGADARFRIADVVELGLHVGTRLVLDTGGLKAWFPNTKANSIDAGLSLAYRVTPLVGVIAGADVVRYGFNFNPVPMTNGLVAGGAVDQYISGYAALRLTLAGS